MKLMLWIVVGVLAALGTLVLVENRGLDSMLGMALTYFSVLCVAWFLYLVPSFVAVHRGHRNEKAIFALNLLAGWSVIGWVVSIVWSLTSNVNEQSASSNKGLGIKALAIGLMPIGLFAMGNGIRSFNTLDGMMWSVKNAYTGLPMPYMRGWIPVLVGGALVGLGLFLLWRQRDQRSPGEA